MNYAKYNGHNIEEFAIRDDVNSYYNHNYYIDRETNHIIEAISDDEDYTYYIDTNTKIEFAESFISTFDLMHVYDEFSEDDK